MKTDNHNLAERFDKKRKKKSHQSFNEHIDFLKDMLNMLSKYWSATGRYHPYLKDIQVGLEHADPFIIHKASIAASLLIEDRKIYH